MKSDRYPRYVLGVLVVVYVFNFLDRQILSILAERIKANLGVSSKAGCEAGPTALRRVEG